MSKPNPTDGPKNERTISQQTVFTDRFLAEPILPPISAADVEPGDYTEVAYDNKQCWAHRNLAEERAPNPESSYRHHIGVIGEHAVSVWWKIPLDTRIMDDYEGDDGYDLKYPQEGDRPLRVEVKTTQKQEPEASVNEDRVDKADLFVLCQTNGGLDRVEIIGYASRPSVKEFGDHYGQLGYQLVPEYLHPTLGKYISPEEVRYITNRL